MANPVRNAREFLLYVHSERPSAKVAR